MTGGRYTWDYDTRTLDGEPAERPKRESVRAIRVVINSPGRVDGGLPVLGLPEPGSTSPTIGGQAYPTSIPAVTGCGGRPAIRPPVYPTFPALPSAITTPEERPILLQSGLPNLDSDKTSIPNRTNAVHLQMEAITMASTKTRRLELRTDQSTDELITEAAELLHVTKSAFVTDAARQAAQKVISRSDVTLMAPEVFDAMMASLDVPDESAELAALSKLPRLIGR